MSNSRVVTKRAVRPGGAGYQPASPALLAGARAGEPEALAEIFEEYARRMLGVAQRITGSEEDARDVVQDVFVGLPEALRGFDGTGALPAWLRRITVRAALLRLRSERRRAKWHHHAGREAAREHRPSAVEARVTLERVLRRMPEELRVVYVLKEVEGYSHADISSMLGISPGASEVRLHRARRFLKDRLEGRI